MCYVFFFKLNVVTFVVVFGRFVCYFVVAVSAVVVLGGGGRLCMWLSVLLLLLKMLQLKSIELVY